jgi:GDP-L-fucose synthase
MVGSAIVRQLSKDGFSNVITRSHDALDLTDQHAVRDFFQNQTIEYVVLAAAKVGGIHANNTYPAEFIHQNIMIVANVISEACRAGVQRLLYLGSSCIYPKDAPQPLKEEHLLTGQLEPTNEPYAIAKIAGIKLCEAYNRQYGSRYRAVMPTNLYGPNDNFDLENSHVLPALIRKFHLAKLAVQGDWQSIKKDESRHGGIPDDVLIYLISISRLHGHDVLASDYGLSAIAESNSLPEPGVTLWGSGQPRREFLYVDDLADACVFVMKRHDNSFDAQVEGGPAQILNIGSGEDQTIRELAGQVANVVGYTGNVFWDTSKPDGVQQKLLDVSRISASGWQPTMPLQEGIKQTYAWYLKASEV